MAYVRGPIEHSICHVFFMSCTLLRKLCSEFEWSVVRLRGNYCIRKQRGVGVDFVWRMKFIYHTSGKLGKRIPSCGRRKSSREENLAWSQGLR